MIRDQSEERSKIGFRKLLVFQKAKLLVLAVYRITASFPRYELYGLTSQLQRAAVSILLNIAEGYVRNSKKDFARFMDMSLGSCAEVDVLLELAQELGYITHDRYNELEAIRSEVGKMLYSFRRSLRS